MLFPDFINYFEKNFIKSNQYGNLSFNYHCLVDDEISEGIKFYTNNITESFNKNLNTKYVGGAKTFFHFKKALFDILDLYKEHREYKNRYISITRALAFQCKNNNIIDLITKDDIISYMREYKNYLNEQSEYENLLKNENSDYSSEDENLMDVKNESIYNNDIIDTNSIKDSSDSENSEKEINYEKKIKNEFRYNNLSNNKILEKEKDKKMALIKKKLIKFQ